MAFLRLVSHLPSLVLLALAGAAADSSARAGVHDQARALEPAEAAALERRIAAFEAETGVELHVKAISYLDPGVSMREATRTSRRALASAGPAALILIDRSQNGLGISHSPELWQRYPLADLVELLRGALDLSQRDPQPISAKLVATAEHWMAGVRRLEADRQAVLRPFKPTLLVFGGVFLGTLGLGAAGLGLLARREQARRLWRDRRYLFPDIHVGQRLGAVHGGGLAVGSEESPPAVNPVPAPGPRPGR